MHNEALHASMPQGEQCAVCLARSMPCPACYTAYWINLNPQALTPVRRPFERPIPEVDFNERCMSDFDEQRAYSVMDLTHRMRGFF